MKSILFFLTVFFSVNVIHCGVMPYFGTRSMALGGCGTAWSSPSEAVYFNSALLPGFDKEEFYAFSSKDGDFNETKNQISLKYSINKDHAGAFSAHDSKTEMLSNRDENGDLLGFFSSYERNFSLGYGVNTSSTFSTGISAHFEFDKILDYRADSTFYDLGFLYKPHSKIMMGLSFQNLDRDRKYKSISQDTYRKKTRESQMIRAGTAINITESSILQFDIEKEESDEMRFHAGYESWYKNRFVFRGGWNHDHLTCGMGISLTPHFIIEWSHSFEDTGDFSLFAIKSTFNRFNIFGEDINFRKKNSISQKNQPVENKVSLKELINSADNAFAMGNIKNAEELYLKAYSICNEEKVKNSINTILRTIENNKFSKEIELAKQSGGDSFRKGYFHLGKIYAQNQNPEKGIEYILNALTEQPNNPLYLMELALLYSRTDQIRKADETLTKLEKITKNPILSEKITNLRTLLLNR